MIEFEAQASNRLVRQIAHLERLVGQCERLCQNQAILSDKITAQSFRSFAHSCTVLDSSTSLFDAEQSDALINAAELETPLSTEGLLDVVRRITGVEEIGFREKPASFSGVLGEQKKEMRVFPAVSQFIVGQRTNEILEWVNAELEQDTYHPLIVIGAFHLLLLQTSPFTAANHRLALFYLRSLLIAEGYQFIGFVDFAKQFHRRRNQYFQALRQAEKTACSSWASLNAWLEFFLDSLTASCSELVSTLDKSVDDRRLTEVQRKIVEVVRENGPVSRDAIATETGINVSTVKYNLGVLSERGHLKRQGGGRSTSYLIN